MAKPRLNQIVAVVTGKKSRAEKEFGELNKIVQRADLFNGFVRQYRPLKDNEEEKQPEEYKSPQQDIKDVIIKAREVIAGIADAIATQECGNCVTSGNVTVDGKVLLAGMPVTVLLYLEKQLQDLHTFVGNFPILDPAERWEATDGQFCTVPTETIRTKKVKKPVTLYPHTDKHPAQTQLIDEDINVGFWKQTKFSKAISVAEKSAILARILKLQDAVKVAREEANNVEIEQKHIADPILSFVFGS